MDFTFTRLLCLPLLSFYISAPLYVALLTNSFILLNINLACIWDMCWLLKGKARYRIHRDGGYKVPRLVTTVDKNQTIAEEVSEWTNERNGMGVPNLWDLMPDDLRHSWCNNNRNKVHNKGNVLQSSWNHLPHPSVWKYCLPQNWSLIAKMLGTAGVKDEKEKAPLGNNHVRQKHRGHQHCWECYRNENGLFWAQSIP